jgi:hypothetical protein
MKQTTGKAQVVGGSIIYKQILERFDFAQDRGQWRALVNMVMNLQVP